MTKIRRKCACAQIIEAEDDEASQAHAVAVHSQQPEHVAGINRIALADEKVPPLRVMLGARSPLVRRVA